MFKTLYLIPLLCICFIICLFNQNLEIIESKDIKGTYFIYTESIKQLKAKLLIELSHAERQVSTLGVVFKELKIVGGAVLHILTTYRFSG